MPIRVMLADDHTLLRQGLRRIIESDTGARGGGGSVLRRRSDRSWRSSIGPMSL